MDDKQLRIGVIGLGAIGPSHIFAIGGTEGCELSAVCDVRAEAAARAAEEHGVPGFASVREMLAADVVDAATLCTPSGLHLDAALEVLRAGKHLLVEKPMEITTERVDRIIAAAVQSGATLGGVFQSRFGAVVRRLKELVDGGLLGEIYSGSAYIKRYRTQEYYDSGDWRGTWRIDGGGCLMNQGIHCVDLFLWFMGGVEEVIAITETMGRTVEVETLALSLVKFTSGARGVIEGTTLAYPEFSPYIEIYGSRGTLAFNGGKVLHLALADPTSAEAVARDELFEQRRALEAAQAKAVKKEVAPGTAVPFVDMGHTPVVTDFVAAVREGRDPFISGREARRSVAVINAIYESGRQNSKPVKLCV